MIIQTKELQEACKKVLLALDTDSASKFTSFGYDSVEIDANKGSLAMNVSNGTYYTRVIIPCGEGKVHAVVDGKRFLSLIAKVTVDAIELESGDASLVVKANGKYAFPFKYDNEGNASLPPLPVGEVTSSFPIDGSVLIGISKDNSKELAKRKATRPSQNLYYIDGSGCITWTNSTACLSLFNLKEDVSFFLTQKVAKMLSLFVPGEVLFSLGHVQVGKMTQTRVSFEQAGVSVVAAVPAGDDLLSSVPKTAIRSGATKDYASKATFDVKVLSEALGRLSIFDDSNSVGYVTFTFGKDHALVVEPETGNEERVQIEGGTGFDGQSFTLVTDNLSSILSGLSEPKIDLCWDDGQMVIASYGSVRNVIAKCGNRK